MFFGKSIDAGSDKANERFSGGILNVGFDFEASKTVLSVVRQVRPESSFWCSRVGLYPFIARWIEMVLSILSFQCRISKFKEWWTKISGHQFKSIL